jgi:hypothetical protein
MLPALLFGKLLVTETPETIIPFVLLIHVIDALLFPVL